MNETLSALAKPVITMVSGEAYSIDEIFLTEASVVRELLAIKMECAKLAGGGSQGLGVGFAGDPAFVAGGVVVAGVLGALVSAGAKQQLQENLAKLAQAEVRTAEHSRFFSTLEVSNVLNPQPSLWKASTIENIRGKKKVTAGSSNSLIGKMFTIETEEEYTKELKSDYVIMPSEFIRIKSQAQTIDVRWSQVVTFRHSLD